MIQQGHAYDWHDLPSIVKVIALESMPRGQWVTVRVCTVRKDGFPGVPFYAATMALHPRPMTYFHGQIPQ